MFSLSSPLLYYSKTARRENVTVTLTRRTELVRSRRSGVCGGMFWGARKAVLVSEPIISGWSILEDGCFLVELVVFLNGAFLAKLVLEYLQL